MTSLRQLTVEYKKPSYGAVVSLLTFARLRLFRKLTVKAATNAVKPISHFEDLNPRNAGGCPGFQGGVDLLSERNIFSLPIHDPVTWIW